MLRDLQRVPKKADPNDPWEKSEPECVFLGKGIFLDDIDPKRTRDWLGPQWEAIPVPARELVVDAMTRLDLRFFELSNTQLTICLIGNTRFADMVDPIAHMQACAAFLVEFNRHIEATAGTTMFGRPKNVPIKCNYCRSIFVIAAGRNECPNCGAPAAG